MVGTTTMKGKRSAPTEPGAAHSNRALDIEGVGGMPRSALAERWMAAYGRPPPKGLSRRLLEHAVAYGLQTRVRGGLKPALRRALAVAASNSAGSAQILSPAKKLQVGMRLLREWGGRTHTVEVSDHGFVWEGRRYASLSAIARQIAGARWSGPRFFGL